MEVRQGLIDAEERELAGKGLTAIPWGLPELSVASVWCGLWALSPAHLPLLPQDIMEEVSCQHDALPAAAPDRPPLQPRSGLPAPSLAIADLVP